MAPVPKRPGKTAPRFVQDILCYDPANPPSSDFNLLTDVLPVFSNPNVYPEITAARSCPHRYVTKSHQTELPPETQPGIRGGTYKVSSICVNCRYHIELGITYKDQFSWKPTHLHHLVYLHKDLDNSESNNPFQSKGQKQETYYFKCSYPTCSASVSLKLRSPLLTPEWVGLLTDENILKQRADDAVKREPGPLEGISRPFPITVLGNLRKYIENALHDKQKNRAIAPGNKRFMICFGVGGEHCRSLLEFVGFTSNDKGSWNPPQPEPNAIEPYEGPLNIFLDNISHELLALMNQRPEHEKENQGMDLVLTPSLKQFNQLLGSLNYDKLRPYSLNQQQRAPYYEDLGALEDMSNNLIIEAYNRQVDVDPARRSYYFRCLRTISHWRGSLGGRVLSDFLSSELADGKYADDDVPHSYSYFQLDYSDKRLTDDAIIGSFFARLQDSGNDVEPRRHLWRIGDYRGSQKIKDTAEDRVATLEQAEVFLGVERETQDDFIISMYTTKVSDTPSSKELAKRAVNLIADARNSDALRRFLRTGEIASTEMDVGDAFRLLQIPDRTVDDGAILAAFSVCCMEAPEQKETYQKALSIIAKEKDSTMIRSMLAEEDSSFSGRALLNWPIGLRNIGNTCYLNSLLQFYFTIEPFRKLVMNVEDYKTGLDDETIQRKKVGSRKVSRSEIERSQKFLSELRRLFFEMITSPNPSIIPSQELARLTLLSSSNEAAIRRKSMSKSKPTELGEINGLPVLGPLGPPAALIENKPIHAEGIPAKVEPVDETIITTTHVPSNEVTDENTGTSNLEGMEGDVKPGNSVAEDQNAPNASISTEAVENPPSDDAMKAPNRPPPVPPRPSVRRDSEQQIKDEVELGAQQDVTEVINNVLFQTQCAIKPTKVDADGNQNDLVTDLFYGKTKSHLTAAKGVRSKEEMWSDIKVDVATGSRDIYAAIDGAFDKQNVYVEGSEAEQYGTISKLPPILQIQVQRVQFDQVKKTSFKSTHHLDLKETIYLDRYMDVSRNDSLGLYKRRQERWAWKEELHRLLARRAELVNNENWESLPNVFTDAKKKFEDLKSMKDDPYTADEAVDIDDSVISQLSKLEDMTRNEIIRIETRAEELTRLMDAQYSNDRTLPYHLYAVFVHHGSVEFGHYYIYIFDFEKQIWRKYNDSEVTEVHNTAEIFSDRGMQNPPTPYFLVYLNGKLKERVAKPVFREVKEVPLPPQPATEDNKPRQAHANEPTQEDTEMTDGPPSYDEINAKPPGREGNSYSKDDKTSLSSSYSMTTTTTPSRGDWEKDDTDLPHVQW